MKPLEQELVDALRQMLTVYGDLMPGVRYLALQDYAILNDAPRAAEQAIRRAVAERRAR